MLKTIHITTYGVKMLFSKTMFKICFIRESSDSSISLSGMDAFLNKQIQKSIFTSGAITCVHGKPGIGKTYFVTHNLPQCVIVDHDILKSRQGTLDFFERLSGTDVPVVFDNWESIADLIGVREIQAAVTNGPTVIIARHPIQLTPNVVMYEMPLMSPEKIIQLAPHHPRAKVLAEKCKGDVRFFLQNLVHESDDPDIFETPREFVEKLITCPHPTEYLNRHVHEHGYVWNMIAENYPDAKKLTLETCSEIADSLSLAEMYDSYIYNKNAWDTLMPYFIESGCIRPCFLMKQTLGTKKLRAGSMWTKYQNICMRSKKIMASRMTYDALLTLRVYIEHEEFDILKDYPHLDSSVIDILNHIIIGKKIKARTVERAKNILRQYK